MGVRLEWDGKPTHVERISLPFQTVETINESRATRERDAGSLLGGGERDTSWRNLLIWGDNKLVMSSLLKEFAGKIKLIYIDPPFATGEDFSVKVQLGSDEFVKTPSVLEEHAYRDTWGRGRKSYLTMMHERLVLAHELLAEDGSIFLHCDWRMNSALRLLMDEIFGSEQFRNEIAWHYSGWNKRLANSFERRHDSLLFYGKSQAQVFNSYFERWTSKEEYVRKRKQKVLADDDGREYVLSDAGAGQRVKRYLDEALAEGVVVDDVWTLDKLNNSANESVGYATQKPEALLERIVDCGSEPGDLVADFFLGSGTTTVVAEKLGRCWIGCDLGRFAIHTTRKRLLNIPDCRPFEIRNLGAYERQRWRHDSGNGALRGYLDTILAFYRAEPVEGFQHLHGRKAGRMVHVGATDAPVTIDEAEEVMDELADNGIESCDLLGWEWEMGLHDTIGERARRRGLDLRALQIPREVMERQVQEADAVRFFELAHVDLDVRRQGSEAKIVLKDFAIPSEDLIPPQVRERITRWSDLIDYWSVDFDHRDGVFHNQWQTYRTRAEPVLATESDWHEYPAAGRYAIVVKIIDIFGNDTTKLAEVAIK